MTRQDAASTAGHGLSRFLTARGQSPSLALIDRRRPRVGCKPERVLLGKDDRRRGRRSPTGVPRRGALQQAGIPCVIVGGHAVAAWVARVDREAVRNTKDVDVLVRREDFARVIDALQAAGFVHQNIAGVNFFLDGPQGSVRAPSM